MSGELRQVLAPEGAWRLGVTAGLGTGSHQLPLDALDCRLIAAIQAGLPLVSRPYAEIGRRLGLSEQAVIDRLQALRRSGAIKRWGVVVRHRELGYQANAMVVFDVADARVRETGRRLVATGLVTLCYRRPRRGSVWPYNLFCMIHGRDRVAVEHTIVALIRHCGLEAAPRAVLFSRRCFKQCGARYGQDGVPRPGEAAPFALRPGAFGWPA